MRVHQQIAYVLLNRPYSETSWIVEVFSREHGRLALMAKGARRIKSKLKGVLLPFQPVLLSWTGKGEIPTLTSAEIDQSEFSLMEHELKGDGLVCGFYCNELIVNLLHRHDPHSKLFDQYHATLMALNAADRNHNLATALRDFEQVVIRETGYEVSFKLEADGKTNILPQAYYRFQPGQGFHRVPEHSLDSVLGRAILSIDSSSGEALHSGDISQGKHLMRDILSQTLGHKKIISRELFFPKTRESETRVHD